MDFSSYPITIALIALNVIVSLFAFRDRSIIGKAGMWPYGVRRKKEYYRFVTSGFLHADYMHLFFNMFTLFFFGRNLEMLLKSLGLGGAASYLALYFIALIISDLPTYFKQKDNPDYVCIGASGAVSAVVFATIVFSPWTSIYLYGAIKISALVYAVLFVFYSAYMGKKTLDNVNHDAHLWGALFGVLFIVVLIAALQPFLFTAIIEELKHPSLFGDG